PDVVDDSGDGQISVGTLVNNNALADLAPLFDAPSLDDPAVKVRDTLLPGALDVGTYNDKVYVLNYGYTVYGLWYNAKLFRERGWRPPRTWTEFTTLAPVIKAAGIAPLVHAGKYPFYMGVPITDWVAKVGGQQLTVAIDNLEPNAWRNDAVRTAVNAALELVRSGWVLPGAEGMSHTESQQAFLDGKAAFIPVGSWLENEMRKTIPPGTELTLIPMPSLTDHDAMPYGAVRAEASEPFIVPAKAHNVNGGLEFLRLMLGRDASRKFSELTSSLCVVKGAADGVTASTALASANRIATSAGDNIIHFRSFIDWYKPFRSEWEAATGELMAGRFTVEEWIDKVQAGADAIAADSTVQKYHRTK
ncbi:MAG: N-acetylglucosamine/diacetylchitobiose ABC transporter substrate-binding protein, partial [Kutzneria sp.]|nr:N-acetylglucosamine/diacetylchitobiose ABC transporter substrate-binding protein [Kutzneria sp.]